MVEADRPKPTFDFTDVMSVVVCHLPDGKVKADSRLWNQAWKEISESPSGQRLITGVHFQDTGYSFYSEEVSYVRHVLGMAGIMESLSPRFEFYVIDEKARRDVLAGQSELISGLDEDIRLMAEMLYQRVKVD